MNLRTIDSMPNLNGKRVLLRVDHNVTYDEEGSLKDDRKLRVTIPTIEFLLKAGAKLICMTHIGRPDGKIVEQLRTKPIADHLASLTNAIGEIKTVSSVVGDDVQHAIDELQAGEILYLENVRFHPGEQKNDPAFVQELAQYGDFFVNEAFPSVHTYEEASTCGIARKLPAFAGQHFKKEIDHLEEVIKDPRRPLVLIISGAKMKTKIPVIKKFLSMADHILIGGCIANTFIAARGFDVGLSRHEPKQIELAQELMLESEREDRATIHVPRDVVVASGEPSETVEKLDLPVEDVMGNVSIYDIGKITIKRYSEILATAGTIVWNGPLGLYEFNRFSHASKRIAEAVSSATKSGAFSAIGGGDTIDFHTRYDYSTDNYSFVSTGGGAMLEFLCSGNTLPAIALLQED